MEDCIAIPSAEDYIVIPSVVDCIVIPSTEDCFMIRLLALYMLLNALPCNFYFKIRSITIA